MYRHVKKQVWNNDGQAVGIVYRNPLLDTIKYKIDYLDGYIEEITTNQISKNMLSQIDSQGNKSLLLNEINNYCKDASDIDRANGLLTINSGNVHENIKTIVWTL